MSQPIPDRDPALAGDLHRAMRGFVTRASRRRSLPAVLHVGRPDAEVISIPDRDWYDAGARADLVTRALDGLADETPLAWLTRLGDLATTNADLAWCAAVRTAFLRHGLFLHGVFVLTRVGWADLISGDQHPWHRVRPGRYLD